MSSLENEHPAFCFEIIVADIEETVTIEEMTILRKL
jgi:hypothetical protein